MSRRSRRGFWWAALLIVAVGYFARGRSDTATRPTASGTEPRVVEKPGRVSPPVFRPASQRDERQLRLRVVGVHDGDTLTGLNENKEQLKVRLDAIDAPELGQPFGQAAKKALSGKVFGKEITVIRKTTDRYGRTVGHVLIDGRDVNLEMLEEGMAWHYVKYDKNARLSRAEAEARAAKKGLWQDRDTVSPWDWRKTKRGARN